MEKVILGDAGLEQHPGTQETPGFIGEKTPCPPQLPRPVHGVLPGGGKAAQKDLWRLQQDGKDGKDRREWEGRQLLSHRGSHLRSSGARVPAAAPAAPPAAQMLPGQQQLLWFVCPARNLQPGMSGRDDPTVLSRLSSARSPESALADPGGAPHHPQRIPGIASVSSGLSRPWWILCSAFKFGGNNLLFQGSST